MTIAVEAPRGGIVEEIGGASYIFLLRNSEIERFEDKHRGIFDLWEGIFGRGQKPKSAEIKDLLALALVGGGMSDKDADGVMIKCGPADLMRLYQIAQACVGIAFLPDVGEDVKKNNKDQPQNA